MTVTRSNKLNGAGPKIENGVKRGLMQAAMIVAQRAQGKAPRDTGRLKRSIAAGQVEQVGSGRWAVSVGTNLEYAAIQEFGGDIDPYPIFPKNKKALAFEWPNAPAELKPGKDGRYVFKSVMHPGAVIKAQPYLRPAIKESEDIVKGLILKNIVAALTK